VGTMTDRRAEVLAGLEDGDSVVVYPSDQVHEGLRVRSRQTTVAQELRTRKTTSP
jgi:HlyD family secretion protein